MLKRVCALIGVMIVSGWAVRAGEPVSPVCAAVAAGRDVNRELAGHFAKEIADGEAQVRRRFCGDAGAVYGRVGVEACSSRPKFVVSLPSSANCVGSRRRVWRVADGGSLAPVAALPNASERFSVKSFENRGVRVEIVDEHASDGELVVDGESSGYLDWADGGVQFTWIHDVHY